MSKTLKFTLLAALRSAVALLFMSGLLTRCASIMTPDGGPIDTLAPVIVAMNPDNFSTSFDKKKIYIEFDEFVQIKDQSKEFYTSPKMKYKPALSTRGRGIVVTIRDTLLENTTYALNFGSSIADNNEGNPLNTMRYVFSTGKTIDSMMLSGYTEDSFKSDSVGKSFIYLFIKDSVELHADYDSIMFKYEPSAIARAENNGIFLAQNLKPIDYYIYAFQDTNDNQLYEAGTDLIGFLPGSYNPSRMEDFGLWFDTIRKYIVADPQLHFKMFTDKAYSRQLLNSSTRESQHKALLYFNAEYPIIDSIRFDALTTEQVVIEPLSFTKDTIALWFDAPSESLPDTLHGTITFHKHDSLNRLLPTTEPLALAWKYYMSKEEEKEIDRLDKERKRALSAGEEWVEPKKANPFKYQFISEEKLNPELGMTMEFGLPLHQIDTTQIYLTSTFNAIVESVPFRLRMDSSNMRRYHLMADWKPYESIYELNIPEGAISDIAGDKNDSIVKKFNLLKESDFATVNIILKGAENDPSSYIVQIANSSGSTLFEKYARVGDMLTFKFVPAGEIQIRVIQDMNHNNRWDIGSLTERRQSELSATYTRNGESIFTTRVNWDIDLEIDLVELFAPENMQRLVNRLEEQERARIKQQRIDDANKRRNQNSTSGGFFNPTSFL